MLKLSRKITGMISVCFQNLIEMQKIVMIWS